MNEKIKEQLKKCKTPIPEFDDSTIEITIPRSNIFTYTPSKEDFSIGNQYLVKVNKSLVIPCDWYYTIHSNWNKGIGPTDELLYIKVLSKAGKMINVAAVGYNNKSTWYGWLPQSNMSILEYK